ncbi:uncharacterized protein LOC112035262 [Quercus suber]|uniref:uncharacterized protein LOC112035262 n=1 Tax=Quercus suber TaxID=58331 RepID=UPI000CE1C676|nr:uncharacterized protein LOC112024143 [Quercus suber]POF10319.1 hypothetical protein CFP56_64490 [Quercus suber]
MAASPVNETCHHHFRSNSFPTRAHPLISEFNDQLSRLRGAETTSSSSTSLFQQLIGLQDLHDCVDNLLLLPCTQDLAQEQHHKWFNELLDGSLRLLDVSEFARDALIQTKECTREFQSTLCRRRGSKMELTSEIEKYLASRNVIKKATQKALKSMQTKLYSKKNEDLAMVSMLKELEVVTVMVFESLLNFIAGTKLQSKSSGWYVVSKLVHPKKIACEGKETDANEFDKVDVALQSLISHKTSKSDYSIHIQNVQNWMGKLESSIEDVEEVLEGFSRRLVKTRVSFLNILNH